VVISPDLYESDSCTGLIFKVFETRKREEEKKEITRRGREGNRVKKKNEFLFGHLLSARLSLG